MSDVTSRAVVAARAAARRVSGQLVWAHGHASADVEQRRMADEYAAVLGLDLPRDEQLVRFKRATDGAPVVRRVPRHVRTV